MRKLQANEIECRVATVKETGISLLLYKTARVDRAILDETYGVMNWQNDFKVIDGKMYGSISVYDNNKQQWITKTDCGTESNTEAEKGQASDCFKRAGFKWGIGVELYTAPFIWVSGQGNKLKYDKFEVSEIGYSDIGEINKLKIVNSKTKEIVYEIGKYTKENKPTQEVKNTVSPIKEQVQSLRKSNEDDIFELLSECKDVDSLRDLYRKFKDALVGNRRLMARLDEKKREFGVA